MINPYYKKQKRGGVSKRLDITNKEVKEELERIYRERKSWNGSKGPFNQGAINYRTLIVMKQYTLYKIQDARKEKDRKKESFNFEIYKIINRYLKYFRKNIKI